MDRILLSGQPFVKKEVGIAVSKGSRSTAVILNGWPAGSTLDQVC